MASGTAAPGQGRAEEIGERDEMQDARSAGTGVYCDVNEDSEHRATQQIARAAIYAACPKFSVGLTGGIGSGKSTVTDLFAERGATIIDTDVIAHQLTTAGGSAIDAIRAEFGEGFIDGSGALNRAAMRSKVFSDAGAKTRLESILHPRIRAECERAAAAAQGPYVIFVLPLLVESGRWKQRVTRVLVVDCPEETQIARVMARNAMSREQVLAIMASQAPRADRLAAADDVILNDDGLDRLVPQVERLHALYLSLAAKGV